MQRRFRGGQYCEHLPTRTRARQNDGVDFVLRDLRHLTHVSKRGLNILVAHRFSLIPGHVESTAAINARISLKVIETAMGSLREVDGFLFSE